MNKSQKQAKKPNKTISLNPPDYQYKRRLEVHAIRLGYKDLTSYLLDVNKPEKVISNNDLKEIDSLIEKEKQVLGYE